MIADSVVPSESCNAELETVRRQGIQLNALAEGVALTEASDLPADQLIVRATTTAVVRARMQP